MMNTCLQESVRDYTQNMQVYHTVATTDDSLYRQHVIHHTLIRHFIVYFAVRHVYWG